MTYWNRPENGCMDGWMDIEIETQMITCFWACKSISHRDRPMTGCIRHANPILRASSVLSKHVNVLRLVGASKAYSEYFGFSSKQWAVYGARITGVNLPKQWFLISRWRCGFKSHSWQVCFDKVPIAEQIKDYLISPKQVLCRFFNSCKHHERQRAMKQWWSTGEGEHTEAKSAWIKSKLFARCCRREQCFRALCVCGRAFREFFTHILPHELTQALYISFGSWFRHPLPKGRNTRQVSSQLTDTHIIYPMAHTFGHQPNFRKRNLRGNLHRHMETITTPTRMKPDLTDYAAPQQNYQSYVQPFL